MAFDLKKFLKDDMGFNDAEVAELAPKLEAKSEVLEKGFLRQSDYSKHMNDLQAQKKKLDEANDHLNEEMAQFATIQAEGGKITAKMRTDLEKAQQDVLKLTQTITKVATDAGMDPDEVLKGAAVVITKPEEKPPTDLTGYLKTEDFTKHAQQLANVALTLPAELMAIAQEHFDLTGERLDTRTIVSELQTRAGTRNNQKSLNPRDIWEEQHKIPEVRTTKAKNEFDAAIKAAEARGAEAALSQQIPGAHTPEGRHSVVFTRPGESALKRPQPGGTVSAAVAALRSHKYRQGEPAGKTA